MRRRHLLAGGTSKLTICGHETTEQERRFMVNRKRAVINCKRCLVMSDEDNR